MNESPSNRPPRGKFLRAPSPIEFFLIAVILVCCYLLVTQDIYFIRKLFFSEYSFLVLVVMILEYLVIKSADRSKVYQREMELLREYQTYNLLIVRKVEHKLEQLLEKVKQGPDGGTGASDAGGADIYHDLEETLSLLRSRK